MKKLLVFSFIGMLLLASCRQILEVDLPALDVKPVVNCVFSPNRPFAVYLSLPGQPTDSVYDPITDGIVTISAENGSKYVLAHQSEGLYVDSLVFPQVGVKYELEVQVPGYPLLTAEDKIPDSSTQIDSCRLELRTWVDPQDAMVGTRQYLNFSVILKDDPSVDDCMGFEVMHNYEKFQYTADSSYYEIIEDKFAPCIIDSDDPSISAEDLDRYDEDYLLLLKDAMFTSDRQTVSFKEHSYQSGKFWLKFYKYSPACYAYIRAWIIHYYTQSYDFWEIYEPMPMYSNITNGYGIFAGYQTDVRIVSFKSSF